MTLTETHPDFQAKIATLAGLHGRSPDQVYLWWQEFANRSTPCPACHRPHKPRADPAAPCSASCACCCPEEELPEPRLAAFEVWYSEKLSRARDYNQKHEDRADRLEDRAATAQNTASSLFDQARKMADVIPFGQPVASNYRRQADLNYRARIRGKMDKACATLKEAEHLQERAKAAAGNDAIRSEDPEAVIKLREKIAEAEAEQATMKAINAAHKRFLKDPATLDTAELSEGVKAKIRAYVPAYSWEPHPIAPYQMTNLGANIRRMKERLEELRKTSTAEETVIEGDVARFEDNPAENRVRLFFPGKPVDVIRTDLKRNGFRWAPSLGCWQAYRHHHTIEFARKMAGATS